MKIQTFNIFKTKIIQCAIIIFSELSSCTC